MRKILLLFLAVWIIHWNYLDDEFKNIVHPYQKTFATYDEAMIFFHHLTRDYKATKVTLPEEIPS